MVQEKVHGANFSFFTDGKEIKIGKRTAFIEKDENFSMHIRFWNVTEKCNRSVPEGKKQVSGC
ncbi:hypothetical protein EJ377_12530 (plasmid) [Chryseobacterium arthrosphaerae]|uniref:RNA ligase domain-containing protein n=1 Tax=Chryseobacterium arthrosphaerae TaxID=651561 RepID=A0A3S0QHR3_9FLAO|nr:hypothetical protein EJ377_12530 [Chryseobacterium arthrosphaerae]